MGSVGPQRLRKERGSWTGISQLSQSWGDIKRGVARAERKDGVSGEQETSCNFSPVSRKCHVTSLLGAAHFHVS